MKRLKIMVRAPSKLHDISKEELVEYVFEMSVKINELIEDLNKK